MPDKEVNTLENCLRELNQERSQVLAHLAELQAAKTETAEPLGLPARSTPPVTPEEKIELFLSLFRCRESVFPKLWENSRTGKKGYAPACHNEWKQGICDKPRIKCSECPNQAFPALDGHAVRSHLQGFITIGTYAIQENDTCTFLAADFDGKNWAQDSRAYQEVAHSIGAQVAIERSRSGNGAHSWIFFSEPVAARLARRLGTFLLARASDQRHTLGVESYDRLFPNQDILPKGGFGNLIALPLQRLPRERGNSVFIRSDLEPYPDQWAHLSEIRRLSASDLNLLLQKYLPAPVLFSQFGQDTAYLQDEQILMAEIEPSAVINACPEQIEIQIHSQIEILIAELPSRLISRLKKLSTFPNPKYYELLRLRFSTFPHPRFIFSGELQPDRLFLPRGTLDKCLGVFRKSGIQVIIHDTRIRGKGRRFTFTGQLTERQDAAFQSAKKHDTGILVAPPGAGKTIMACALIAVRKTSTLILVHRQQILTQWKSQLKEFLGLSDGEVGVLTGTKKKTTGKIDVAMIQTLAKAEDLAEFVAPYGQIVIDECHHVPAASFEALMKQIPARFILGLTATAYRKDGLEKILFQQCGPVRFEMGTDHADDLTKVVVTKETGFRLPPELSNNPPYHVLAHLLINDEARQQMILNDLLGCLREGRLPLVSSDRKDQLQSFAAELKNIDGINVASLDGEMTSRQRSKMIESIISKIDSKQPTCILATASLIGEGFDLPPLDTLFLAMPLSFKGRLIQYAGRLHRSSEGKTEIRIYDYVDSFCSMTLKMYRRRLTTYRLMGYRVQQIGNFFGDFRDQTVLLPHQAPAPTY